MGGARLPNFDRAINQIVFGLLHQKPKLKNQSEIEFRGFDPKLGGFRWCWIRVDLGLRLLLLRGERILIQFIAIFLYLVRSTFCFRSLSRCLTISVSAAVVMPCSCSC